MKINRKKIKSYYLKNVFMSLCYFQGIVNLELEIESFIFAPRENEKLIIELTYRYESLEMQSAPSCSA